MSGFGSSGPGDHRLGGGYIELEARGTEQLKAEVASAGATVKAETAAMAGATERSAVRQGAANEKAATGFRKFSSSVTSSVGAVTALVGVVVSATAGIFGLANAVEAAAKRFSGFVGGLSGSTTDQLRAVRDRINELEASTSKFYNQLGSWANRQLSGTWFEGVFGSETLVEELDRLKEIDQHLQGMVRTQRQLAESARETARVEEESWKVKRRHLEEQIEMEKRLAGLRAEGLKVANQEQHKFLKEFETSLKSIGREITNTMTDALQRQSRQLGEFNHRQAIAIEHVAAAVHDQARAIWLSRGRTWPGGGSSLGQP